MMPRDHVQQLGLWPDASFDGNRTRNFRRHKQPRPDYLAFLSSSTWERRRGEAIERADFECQDCGCFERLQVHHTDYANLGYEEKSDLEVLCPSCHLDRHPGNR